MFNLFNISLDDKILISILIALNYVRLRSEQNNGFFGTKYMIGKDNYHMTRHLLRSGKNCWMEINTE